MHIEKNQYPTRSEPVKIPAGEMIEDVVVSLPWSPAEPERAFRDVEPER